MSRIRAVLNDALAKARAVALSVVDVARQCTRFLLLGPKWAWLQSHEWAWFSGLLLGGFTVAGVGEFGLAALFYVIAAISCISQLWTWNPSNVNRLTRPIGRIFGALCIVLMLVFLLAVDGDAVYRGGESWSHFP